MELGDAAAWFAAGIAIIAALISLGNANSAKRQAKAAERQAAEAIRARVAAVDAAEASRRSADAAEAGLDIARRAEVDRQAEQHGRDAPVFTLKPAGRTHIEVTLVSGPAEVDVHMTGSDVTVSGGQRLAAPTTLPLDPETHRLARNGSCRIAADVRAEKSSATVRIKLISQEPDSGRRWPWTEEVTFAPPPATASVHRPAGETRRHQQRPGRLYE